jgi:hypothetical protein
MDKVTADDVRALLAAPDPGASLVVLGGDVSVAGPDELGSGRYAGALSVVSQQDLREAEGNLDLDHMSERDLDELAARLSRAVEQLGG